MNVQHWSEENADVRENEYEGIICPACAHLHFLDRKTGKLLGGRMTTKAPPFGG